MTPITTTLREILSTGKLGHLQAGMKRETLAEFMPELCPPDGYNAWRFGAIEVYFQDNILWYYKIVPMWYDLRFPPTIAVTGYIPTQETAISEFINYLEVQKLNYQLLWNSWDSERWPVIFVENMTEVRFTPELSLLGIGSFSEAEIQDHIKTEIAGNITLNIYDILRAYPSLGRMLKHPYKYKPASVQIFEPHDFSPDVSYIKKSDRSSINYLIQGVPDLAVIVVKPKMDFANLNWQVSIYLSEGTQQVWLVYPTTKEIHQYSSATPQQSRIYRGADVIDMESLFPNIQGLNLSAIFKLPKWAIKDKK